MPDALIVYDEDMTTTSDLLNKMVNIGLIKMVSVKGVCVYGRPYLTNRAIREAYKKQTKNS